MFLSFNNIGMPRYYLSGFSTRFQALSRSLQVGCLCITHPFATKSSSKLALFVRLACIRHAASVYPEPGSNSPFDLTLIFRSLNDLFYKTIDVLSCLISVRFSKINLSNAVSLPHWRKSIYYSYSLTLSTNFSYFFTLPFSSLAYLSALLDCLLILPYFYP